MKCASPLISHKFYSGQGGELHLHLTKREYAITVETIWEDYSLLDLEGLSGARNFTLFEEGGVSYFEDKELEGKESEVIRAKLKIPEDYTLKGLVNGSVEHVASSIGKKLRSKPFAL